MLGLNLIVDSKKIDLVAVGSPHASIEEIRKISALFAGRRCHIQTRMKITAGRHTIQLAQAEGITKKLEDAGVQLMFDLCWCSRLSLYSRLRQKV